MIDHLVKNDHPLLTLRSGKRLAAKLKSTRGVFEKLPKDNKQKSIDGTVPMYLSIWSLY